VVNEQLKRAGVRLVAVLNAALASRRGSFRDIPGRERRCVLHHVHSGDALESAHS
jgi:hypothetical protein